MRLLTAFLAAAIPVSLIGATPAAHRTPHPMPTIRFSKVPLHTEFVVEVNKKGQVVRVKSGKSCPNLTFNAQTYGNVLQAFIRKPDGSAIVGLYRVTYDYAPVGHKIKRGVSLVSAGGNWGDKPGAATQMMEMYQKEGQQQQTHPVKSGSLPSLNSITGKYATPTPHP